MPCNQKPFQFLEMFLEDLEQGSSQGEGTRESQVNFVVFFMLLSISSLLLISLIRVGKK